MKTCECKEKFLADVHSVEHTCRRCGGYIVPEKKPEEAAVAEKVVATATAKPEPAK